MEFMKTEREQIEAMAKVMCGAICEHFVVGCEDRDCNVKKYEKKLFDAGYGDVSEYKAEIERLKKETTDTQKGTAKEILQTLYDECYEINDETGESMGYFVSDDDILCLAKHYGVEVKI